MPTVKILAGDRKRLREALEALGVTFVFEPDRIDVELAA